MQVLELAGRRRATEPSSPVNAQEVAPSKITKPLGRRRAKSDTVTAHLKTSVAVPMDTPTSSPYSSPTEASYASLARSLAQASVAVRQASFVGGVNDYSHGIVQAALTSVSAHPGSHHYSQDIEIPWQQPTSAFSDWGSSRNSMAAYTPTPAGQLEDPFEFDSPVNNKNISSSILSNVPIQDNFDMFAAAIEMNRYTRPFVMPTFPTNELMRRRKLSPPVTQRDPAPSSTKDRHGSSPSEIVGVFSTPHPPNIVGPDQLYADNQSSIATRRKQSGPTLLRSGKQPSRRQQPSLCGSFKGALPAMPEEITSKAKLKRQPHSMEGKTDEHPRARGSLQAEPGPFNLNIFNAPICTSGCGSPKLLIPSSPKKLEPLEDEGYSFPSPTPRAKQGPIPDLEFGSSDTPVSATFDTHMPPLQALPDTYRVQLPEDQLSGFSQYYDLTSEGSSASSGILLGKETNAFPFEEFLQARVTAANGKPWF